MVLPSSTEKNRDNSQAVEQKLPKKELLSPRTVDIIGATFWITLCCLITLAALGLILWAATTNVGFTSDALRWGILSLGACLGVPALFMTLLVSALAIAMLPSRNAR